VTNRKLFVVPAVALFLTPTAIQAQNLSPCDLNQDGVISILDVQLAINMALGSTPCSANIAGPGVCNVVVVQRVTNAVLGGLCVSGLPHSVSVSWTASTSQNVTYNVYRSTVSSGPYTKMTSQPVSATTYTDNTVQGGQVYFYVATAVDSSGNESVNSNQAQAVIPSP
jgi:hypothetical protein